MAYFMLFNVPKSEKYHTFKKELSKFGTINFFKLATDLKNRNFQFGQLNYSNIYNKNELLSFLHSKCINSQEKESNPNNTQQNEYKKNSKQHSNIQENVKPKKIINIPNPSFHFYKDEAYGKDIEEFQFSNNYIDLFEIKGAKTFELTTIYPGLLVGSGYNHPKLKDDKDNFQLGFFFDYTTGLPLISGSSIKGVLKSVISNQEFMDDVYETKVPLDIFEDNQTIFYDAFMLSTKNKCKKIFESDYITSHYSDDEEWGEFKNPNPIKFLKILPDVTFQFQFKCDEKYISIFKEIIKEFGLGAKTNTGYGKFLED